MRKERIYVNCDCGRTVKLTRKKDYGPDQFSGPCFGCHTVLAGTDEDNAGPIQQVREDHMAQALMEVLL